MECAENNFQPSKKRAAGAQLSRDNPGLDDDETSDPENGTFKRASDEVIAARRIVKVRRQQTSSTSSAPVPAPTPSTNPFAAIRLVPSASSDHAVEVGVSSREIEKNDKTGSKFENEVVESKEESTAEKEKFDINNNAKQSESNFSELKTEPNINKDSTDNACEQNIAKATVDKVAENETSEDGAKTAGESDNSENDARKDAEDKGNAKEYSVKETVETASFFPFKPLSSGQNAFSGFAGTGFSSTLFSFGSVPKDGTSPDSSGSLFGLKNDQPSFSFGLSNNGNSSIFGTSAANTASKSESSKIPAMQEVTVETGEENEEAVFTADSVLFEYVAAAWKERGKGELKVNVSKSGAGKGRLIMRAKGNYRLILNASLYPDLKMTNMDMRGVTFACVNSATESIDGLSTIALKFKDSSTVEKFRAAVTLHKDTTPVVLKTPENSPKASDE